MAASGKSVDSNARRRLHKVTTAKAPLISMCDHRHMGKLDISVRSITDRRTFVSIAVSTAECPARQAREGSRLTRTDLLEATPVAVALDSLADRRVFGVLEIEGDPAGAIYLNQGQITFARPSWIPDLGARLAAVLRHMATSPDLLAGPDRPDRDIGSALVQRNYLSRGELQAILRSVIVDAAIVLTVRGGDDAFVSDIRFAAPGAPWAGAVANLRVGPVPSEALQRAEHMARYHLNRTTEVRLADLARPSAVLSRRQWGIASAEDGIASVQDLAWQCGMALYDTIECVGHLVRAGLCVPCGTRPGAMVRPRQPEFHPEPV